MYRVNTWEEVTKTKTKKHTLASLSAALCAYMFGCSDTF